VILTHDISHGIVERTKNLTNPIHRIEIEKTIMSKRSYTACYIHLIWGVKDRQLLLKSEEARIALRKFINQYVKLKKINLKIMFINPEHIHLLIELATNQTIEDIVKLIKGSSLHWINQNDIIKLKFA
jgi:putative transposase